MKNSKTERNKKLKQECILNGTFKKYTDKRNDLAKQNQIQDIYKNKRIIQTISEITGEITSEKIDFDIDCDLLDIEPFGDYSQMEIYKVCENMRNAKNHQWKYNEKRIRFWKSRGDYLIMFATLTFTDRFLKSTSENYRRDYVGRTLSQHCDDYIANIDYGDLKGREHYHAILVIHKDKVSEKDYKSFYAHNHDKTKNYKGTAYYPKWAKAYKKHCGNIYIEKVQDSEIATTKTCRYLAKLVNHSLKVKQSRLLCKKNTDWQRQNELDKVTNKVRTQTMVKNESTYQTLNKLDKAYRENYKETHGIAKAKRVKQENERQKRVNQFITYLNKQMVIEKLKKQEQITLKL